MHACISVQWYVVMPVCVFCVVCDMKTLQILYKDMKEAFKGCCILLSVYVGKMFSTRTPLSIFFFVFCFYCSCFVILFLFIVVVLLLFILLCSCVCVNVFLRCCCCCYCCIYYYFIVINYCKYCFNYNP